MSDGQRPRSIGTGVLLWVLLCFVMVFVRGIRWDDHYGFAQVALRLLAYPEGHPLFRCVREALNLQLLVSYAVVWLTPNPDVLCGYRNILSLIVTLVPVYFLAARLSGRAVVGHAAALLALMSIHLEFDGCYPLEVWPTYFSSGHFGRGYALLVLCLLLTGYWRAGGFLLGLMPSVHIGQMPIVLAWSVLLGLAAWRSPDRRRLARALPWVALGLALCGGVWLCKNLVSVPPPTEGPYYSDAHPGAISAGLRANDPHRALPGGSVNYGNSFIVLGAALLLTLAAARVETRRDGQGKPWLWLFTYMLLVAGAVWGIMLIQVVLGDRTPYLLTAWMPYRFTNHAAVLLLAALPCVLCGALGANAHRNAAAGAVLAAGMLYGIVRPLLALALPDSLYARYFAFGDGLFFLLMGAALGVLFRQLRSERLFVFFWLGVTAAAFVAMLFYHQFGALASACGFGLALALSSEPAAGAVLRIRANREWPLGRALPVMCAILLAVLLCQEWRSRHGRVVTPFDREVAQYLDSQGEQDAMVVARPDQYSLQERIGHPILADAPFVFWVPYIPSAGPAVQKICDALYGIRFDAPSGTRPEPWTGVWTNRSCADWRKLSREYAFRYVLAPANVPLDLREVLRGKGVRGEEDILYRIPEA